MVAQHTKSTVAVMRLQDTQNMDVNEELLLHVFGTNRTDWISAGFV